MTDEMLALANENKRKAGAENVEFLKGEIENIPLPSNSVDVIISNCVINLSADKDRALREAFRVLKPGGRFAVSDVVTRGEINEEIRKSVLLWVGCVAGALDENEYHNRLAAAGFEQISTAASMPEAVEQAAAAAAPGDVVLLAPACASFDWYRSFEERGRAFKDAVAQLEHYGKEGRTGMSDPTRPNARSL